MTKVKSQSRQEAQERRIREAAAAEQADRVRQEIRDVIVASSLDMTRSVVRTVKRRGSAASMRFLWSIAGIMQEPAAAKVVPTRSSLQTLMAKLELYEKPAVATVDSPGGDVKSQEQSRVNE